MKILFLDDQKSRYNVFKRAVDPSHHITYVDNADICVVTLQSNNYDFIFLDHDLSEEDQGVDPAHSRTRNGSYVAEKLATMYTNLESQIIVHSLNSYAGTLMVQTLREAGFNASYFPFGWKSKDLLTSLGLIRNFANARP